MGTVVLISAIVSTLEGKYKEEPQEKTCNGFWLLMKSKLYGTVVCCLPMSHC